MGRSPNNRKFEADVPNTVWEAYETWAQDRPGLTNRQLIHAMFRLFLAAPETLKQLSLSGRPDQMERACLYYVEEIVQELLDSAAVPPGEQGEILAAARKHAKGSRRARGRKVG
jgi:hypothetical protein